MYTLLACLRLLEPWCFSDRKRFGFFRNGSITTTFLLGKSIFTLSSIIFCSLASCKEIAVILGVFLHSSHLEHCSHRYVTSCSTSSWSTSSLILEIGILAVWMLQLFQFLPGIVRSMISCSIRHSRSFSGSIRPPASIKS